MVGPLDLRWHARLDRPGADDGQVGAGASLVGESLHPPGHPHVPGEGGTRDAGHLDAKHDIADRPELADERVGQSRRPRW